MMARGLSDAAIAKFAGIAPRSLQNRRLKLGLSRTQNEWTAQEVRELRQLFRRGLTDDEIARHLGRTAPNAVAGRRTLLGLLRLEEEPWTESDKAALRRMWGTSATVREIAAVLGRSPGAVTQARRRVGLEPRT